MNDIILRVATDTATLPNREAWARIEELLAEEGVPRRDWSRARNAAWAERLRQRPVKSRAAMISFGG